MPRYAANVGDYRALAKARLPHFLFEYIDGGSYEEVTLGRNPRDLQDVVLRQRVMRDVSAINISTRLLGRDWAMPVGLGPVGLAGMFARRGEVQAAKAASAAKVPFTLSTLSGCTLEEVAAKTDAPFWFQLYIVKDREFVRAMLGKAKEAGCSALLLTVDLPVPSARYREYRAGMSGPLATGLRRWVQSAARPGWVCDVGLFGRPHTLGNVAPMIGTRAPLSDLMGWVGSNFDATVSWKDIDWVRQHWDGPLIIKGILDPDDAREAVAMGADGIVVSNHGGRQLDGVSSTARALPAIAEAVGGKIPVLADGGVRSGLDVVRMLALGADFVLLGRAWAYALAGGGGAGVANVLQLIEAEIRAAMAMTGCTKIGDIGAAIIAD